MHDWKIGGHKHFCGIAKEEGFDWEVCDCGDKGVGVFALRNIPKDDKIIVERPIVGPCEFISYELIRYVREYRPEDREAAYSIKDAIIDLYSPDPSDLDQKATLNSFDHDDGISSLHIKLSRVNHDCLGNAAQRYSKNLGVRLLVASRDIRAGEEITFNYCYGMNRESSKRKLVETYGFRCQCTACKNRSIDHDLDKMYTIESTLINDDVIRKRHSERAIQRGKSCLALYDKYQMPSWSYHWIYYFLFQLAIMKRKNLKESRFYLQKAYQLALSFSSDADDEHVLELHQYMSNPSSHYCYLLHG